MRLVDEVVPQKQKATRDQASLDVKEGPSRVMGKSMSFKSTSSGRSSAGESKLRALSPRPSRLHDLKGLKQVKERNAFERKSLSRLDRSLTVSSMATPASTPKADQKLTPRGEAVSFSSASNNREAKVVKSEGKGSTLTKSNSTLPRKGLEVSGTPGMALLNKVKHINGIYLAFMLNCTIFCLARCLLLFLLHLGRVNHEIVCLFEQCSWSFVYQCNVQFVS